MENGMARFTKIKQGQLYAVRVSGVFSGASSVPGNSGLNPMIFEKGI